MNAALWIVAGLLAAAHLLGGGVKVLIPKEKLSAAGHSAEWAEDFSAGGVKTIGALEDELLPRRWRGGANPDPWAAYGPGNPREAGGR